VKVNMTTVLIPRAILSLLVASHILIAFSAYATPLLTDPTPVVSNSGSLTLLTKDLFGEQNYGVADGAADIVYTGETGTWTFVLSGVGLDAADYNSAAVTLTLVLDDHYAKSTATYSAMIKLPSGTAFNGQTDLLGLPHGAPYGNIFTNWVDAAFTSSLVPDSFVVSLQNTSTTPKLGDPDWIGIDKIQVALTPVPEPRSFNLIAAAVMAGLSWRIWTRKRRIA
jgi:hypothetical protein